MSVDQRSCFSILRIFLLVALTAFSASCVRKINQSTIKLTFSGNSRMSKGVGALSFPSGKTVCYAVNVYASDLPSTQPSICSPSVAVHGGFVQEGQTLSLQVTQGADRTLEVFAFLKELTDTTPCPAWNTLTDVQNLDYEKTYLVGTTSGLNISGAEQQVNVTVSYPGDANHLAAMRSLPTSCIDRVAPTITDVTSSATSATYAASAQIDITATFSEAVDVAGGVPRLDLNTSPARYANYVSGTGTNVLTFQYIVQSGDSAADLDYLSTTALTLQGATIKDAAGNSAALTLAIPNASGSISDDLAIVVDAPPPVPSGLSRQSPTNSPEISSAVTIRVAGVISSDSVQLYTDATCATTIGTATISSGTTVDISFNVSSYGTHNFFAKTTRGSLTSNCSTATASYEYLESTTVQSVYTTTWNSYVQRSAAAEDYNHPNTACTSSETSRCIHSGEIRKAAVTGVTSCTNLTASDSLGVFDWKCDASSGTATFYSSLKKTKGLKDLITTSGFWQTNRLLVYENAVLIQMSAFSSWWSNSIAPLPDSSSTKQDLNVAGQIYYHTIDMTGHGWHVTADGIAIVSLSGAKLIYNGSGTATCDSAGSPGTTSTCFIGAGGYRLFLWFEGHFVGYNGVGTPAHKNLVIEAQQSRIHQSTFSKGTLCLATTPFSYGIVSDTSFLNCGQMGMYLNGGRGTLYTNIRVSSAGGDGLFVFANLDNRFVNVVSSNNLLSGILCRYCDNNFFFGITTANNGKNGIILETSSDSNVLVNLLTTSNGSGSDLAGIQLIGSSNNTISHVTTGLNTDDGIYITNGSSNNTLNQVLSVGQPSGLTVNDSNTGDAIYTTNNTFSQLAISGVSYTGIFLAFSTGNKFTNNLVMGSYATNNCYLNTSDGLVSGTCAQSGTSDHVLTSTSNTDFAAPDIFAKLTASDSTNGSSVADGTKLHSSITDWLNFDTPFRTWGKDGTTFPNVDHEDRCTTGTCRVWDWSLKSSASTVRNTSGAGGTPNGTFTAGSACPAAVDGSKFLTDQQTTANTFLINATEIVEDRIGDNDGLCESSEHCVYSPNFGSYQGHGDLTGACTFTDGTLVTGVTMYSHPTNGN